VKVFVVHVYDAAAHLHDYYVHAAISSAKRQAAIDVVTGHFEDLGAGDFEVEVQRVIDAIYEEPAVDRWHVRCDAVRLGAPGWCAHIDEMQVLS
jgi:hypothetical protein